MPDKILPGDKDCAGEQGYWNIENSRVAVFCRLKLTVGNAITELGSLVASGMIVPRIPETRWEHLTSGAK